MVRVVRALVCIRQCRGSAQALEIPFVPVGAADINDRFRAYVQCTVREPVRHFHASMEDQVSGVCCTLHRGQAGCIGEPAGVVDIAVAGSPCPPFSMQRSKRYLDGSVEQHPLYYVTDDILPRWLVRFEPKFAVLEQVMGFDRPTEAGQSVTPLQRPLMFRSCSSLMLCCCFPIPVSVF